MSARLPVRFLVIPSLVVLSLAVATTPASAQRRDEPSAPAAPTANRRAPDLADAAAGTYRGRWTPPAVGARAALPVPAIVEVVRIGANRIRVSSAGGAPPGGEFDLSGSAGRSRGTAGTTTLELDTAEKPAARLRLDAAGLGEFTGTRHAPDLADAAAGVYEGEITSDSRGARSAAGERATVSIVRIGVDRVRVHTDNEALPGAEIDLEEAMGRLLARRSDSVIVVDTTRRPPRLDFSPSTQVSFLGDRRP